MKKRILSGLLCFSFLICGLSFNVDAAKEKNHGGYVANSYVAVDDDSYVEPKGSRMYSKVVGARDAGYWNRFSDNYLYNNMSPAEKRFYDNVKAQCDLYLTTNKDAVTQKAIVDNRETTVNVMSRLPYEGLDQKHALRIYVIMTNSNPHYYFLSGSVLFSEDGKWIYPVFYEAYANGDTRAGYTERLANVVDEWISEASTGANNYEKARKIFDLLCRELDYAKGSWNPHQSIATAVFEGKTVCAGYAECYAIIAKALGIPVVVLTSEDHEWVILKLDDYWYNCDATYGDAKAVPDYRYFAKSDTSIKKYDGSSEGHKRESIFFTLSAPKADFDWEDRPQTPVAPKPQEPVDVPVSGSNTMYRLYNPNSHEHFYTADTNERDVLHSRGWNYEGIAWNAPSASNTPVYRLYFPGSGDHHYTTSLNERNTLISSFGWKDEGIGWYSVEQSGTPLYRLNNPNLRVGAHHYTADANEVKVLVGLGWQYEGIGWYGN